MADTSGEASAYQALYRRYRPQRFLDVLGQEHVTKALRNRVREGKVAHAYLFSGPRGTGKTSTARILAMALNCEAPSDGEPDGTCASCVSIRRGSSMDVQELDAATNRGIDEMRNLLGRVAIGTPGRWKVYIIDEVHQLSREAASALLKTLEEPPAHVIFVLATTDPQRVPPTIRSRTQHFEFHLLAPETLSGLLLDVEHRASLGVAPELIDLVVRRAHGSARDALSALDQVAASGHVDDDAASVAALVDSISDQDPAAALVAIAEAVTAGRDPRRIAADVLDQLRNGFLSLQAPSLVLLPGQAAKEAEERARRLGTAAVVRAMEVVGQALVDMRDSVDPRITLEVALVRLTSPEADTSAAALLARIERLESALGAAAPPPSPSSPVRGDPAADRPPPRDTGPEAAAGPATARAALGALRRSRQQEGGRRAGSHQPRPPTQEPPPAAQTPPSASNAVGPLPTRDAVVIAWGDRVLPSLPPPVKAYLGTGRFVAVDDSAAVYALPDRGLLARAEPLRSDVERALAEHFGRQVPLRFVLDDGSWPPPQSHEAPSPQDGAEESYDLDELVDAPELMSPEQRLLEAFPGAEEVRP